MLKPKAAVAAKPHEGLYVAHASSFVERDSMMKASKGTATLKSLRQHSAHSQGGQVLSLICQQSSAHSKVGRLKLDLVF